MGAGQIGGIATLLDVDFENAAGFLGRNAMPTEGQFMVYYFSQALMFCVGALIEAHIVLTPAMCIFGERYMFEVFGGSHSFLENSGVGRTVQHFAMHRGYNHSKRWTECITDNMALLVLNEQFSFNKREFGSEFVVNRIRYGVVDKMHHAGRSSKGEKTKTCVFFGWGSRRNGYLIPLLIKMRRMEAKLLSKDECPDMWNKDDKFLCLEHPPCKSEDYGALCPDDVGSVLICSGYVKGMMISRLVDRPCGVGFLDMTLYNKFITCAVDDSRDVLNKDFHSIQYTTMRPAPTPSVIVPPIIKPKTGNNDEIGEEKKDVKLESVEKTTKDDEEEDLEDEKVDDKDDIIDEVENMKDDKDIKRDLKELEQLKDYLEAESNKKSVRSPKKEKPKSIKYF